MPAPTHEPWHYPVYRFIPTVYGTFLVFQHYRIIAELKPEEIVPFLSDQPPVPNREAVEPPEPEAPEPQGIKAKIGGFTV